MKWLIMAILLVIVISGCDTGNEYDAVTKEEFAEMKAMVANHDEVLKNLIATNKSQNEALENLIATNKSQTEAIGNLIIVIRKLSK